MQRTHIKADLVTGRIDIKLFMTELANMTHLNMAQLRLNKEVWGIQEKLGITFDSVVTSLDEEVSNTIEKQVLAAYFGRKKASVPIKLAHLNEEIVQLNKLVQFYLQLSEFLRAFEKLSIEKGVACLVTEKVVSLNVQQLQKDMEAVPKSNRHCTIL